MKFIDLAHEAGIPKDALQYVHGSARVVGDLFTNSNYVRKITFTGSTPVGKTLIKDSADTVKHVTMELDGHAPLIVANDADIDYAVAQTVGAKFRNAGQTCVCANRILVHDSIVDEFTEKLTKATKELTVGNGMEEGTDVGPIINKQGYDKITAQIENAVNEGAGVLTGNETDADESYQK